MNPKIAIGIPTGGTMKSKTAFSLMETIRTNKELDIVPIFHYGNFAAENKEYIVEIAQNELCSHLLLVDCDMSFPGDTLSRLLAHDKDITGVLYNYRRTPLQTTAKFFGPNGEPVVSLETLPTDIFKVAGIGTGLLLIKMSVFSQLKAPFFPMEQDGKGHWVLTEDIGFCEKAREAGFDVWCDPTIDVKHVGDYNY